MALCILKHFNDCRRGGQKSANGCDIDIQFGRERWCPAAAAAAALNSEPWCSLYAFPFDTFIGPVWYFTLSCGVDGEYGDWGGECVNAGQHLCGSFYSQKRMRMRMRLRIYQPIRPLNWCSTFAGHKLSQRQQHSANYANKRKCYQLARLLMCKTCQSAEKCNSFSSSVRRQLSGSLGIKLAPRCCA